MNIPFTNSTFKLQIITFKNLVMHCDVIKFLVLFQYVTGTQAFSNDTTNGILENWNLVTRYTAVHLPPGKKQ